MPQPLAPQPSSIFRRGLVAVGVVVVLLAGVTQLDRLFRGGLNAPVDFAAFWAAGHLAAEGQNPYSGDQLRDAQAAVGLTDLAVIAWNPPWTLTLLLPFGAAPFRMAYGLWALAHFGLLVAAVLLLWRAFDGSKRFVWVPLLTVFTFAPTVFLIGNAQLTAVVLFGLAGFAAACRAERPVLAGAALALIATKPHLLVPFAVWFLIAAPRSAFGRRALFGAVAAGALLCVPPTLAAPHVWADYFAAVTGPSDPRIRPLSEWKPPLIGWWVRQAVPGGPFWVQWMPTALAACAVAVWCVRNRTRLSPAEALKHLPLLLGGSLLVAPYGAWSYDLVLLLLPILSVAAKLSNAPDRVAIIAGAAGFASVNALALVMMLNDVSSEWYVWFAPGVLAGMWRLKPTPPGPPSLKGGGETDTSSADALGESEEVTRAFTPLPEGRGAGGVGSESFTGNHP